MAENSQVKVAFLRTSVRWLKAGQVLLGGVVGSDVLDVCMGVCVVEGCGRRVIV